jgi:hypothetical protein
MSTRGTYKIGEMTFYCHYDNYPSGAAQRLANMIGALTVASDRDGIDAVADRRGGLAFAFIRGNMDAEPTKSRDVHGDTEYHYEVSAGEDGRTWVMVFKPDDNRRWKLVNHKPLAEWINTERMAGALNYQRVMAERWPKKEVPSLAQLLEGFPEVVEAKIDANQAYAGRWILATKENAEKLKAAEDAFAVKYGGGNPNGPIHAARANAWALALGEDPELPWTRRNRMKDEGTFIEA